MAGKRDDAALFDESRWRVPVFRLMLPIGVLISVEQAVVASTPSASVAAWFAAALLLALWLMAWHPKISVSRWIGPVGDTLIIVAVVAGCIIDGLAVLVFHDRESATAMQAFAFWVPIIALYFNLVLNRWRVVLAICLSCLMVLFVAAHVYSQRTWGVPVLLASTTTFIGQIIITSGVAIIFSQYRSGFSNAVAQLRVAEAQSMTDSLTGLPNRRNFLNDAKLRWNGQPEVSLLVVDIDNFKAINDSLGHHAGDQVLVAFAENLRDWLPQGALMYRWGGEEFVLSVALPQTQATMVAAQLCEHVRALVLPFGVRLTVSVGGTAFATNESVENAFQRADLALYDAKRAGRNRVDFRAS